MGRKFGHYLRSSSASSPSIGGGNTKCRVLSSAITITIIALLVLVPSLSASSSSFFSYVNHHNHDGDFAAFALPSPSSSSSFAQSETITTMVRPPALQSPLLIPTTTTISSQSSQDQSFEDAAVADIDPSIDNFNLPDGYIIESLMSNLSMPTN
jgi:hypothetical protein